MNYYDKDMKICLTNEGVGHIMQNRIIEEASDEGNNCVFNAFLLGLCEPHVLHRLNVENPAADLKEFIEKASRSLAIDITPFNWAQFKEALIKFKKDKGLELQKKLAQPMRELAANRALVNIAASSESLLPLLLDYFNKYRAKEVVDTATVVGSFSKHNFINAKFEALKKSDLNEQAKLQDLETWWNDSGCKQYLTAMSNPVYLASEFELGHLAAYFGVNITVAAAGNSESYTFKVEDHGQFFNVEQDQLTARGIVDRNGNLLPMTEANVRARINAIPDYETVSKALSNAQRSAQRSGDLQLSGKGVPNGWSTECLQELENRGVIDKRGTFKVDFATAKARIEALGDDDDIKDIVTAWKAAYKNPPMIELELVQTRKGPHYNHVLSIPTPVPPVKAAASTVAPTHVRIPEKRPFTGSAAPIIPAQPTVAASNPAPNKSSQPHVPPQPVKVSAPPPVKDAQKQSAPNPAPVPVVDPKASEGPVFSTTTNPGPGTKQSSQSVPKPVKTQSENVNAVAKPSELIRETISFFEGLRQKCGESYNTAVSNPKAVEVLDKELMAAWANGSRLNATEYKVPNSLDLKKMRITGDNNSVQHNKYLAQMKADRELAIKLQIEEIKAANTPPRKR